MKRRGRSGLSERLKFLRKSLKAEKFEEPVQTWLELPRGNRISLPSRFRHGHVRAADSLVRYCIDKYSAKEQVVFDPFAGYGTTLVIAEEMERAGYGIEFSRARVEYVRSLLVCPERLIHGDSRNLADYDLPPIDLCLTSPPYTNELDTENPFVDYRQKGFTYALYLEVMGQIFTQVAQKLKQNGRLVIEASNLKKNGHVTMLAWDIAREVSKILHFEGEVVIGWEEYGYGYSHSYCLAFSNTQEALCSSRTT